MKIIAGKHKGRTVEVIKLIEKNGYRPTTSKIKEALFSILSSGRFLNEEGITIIKDAIIADFFCGSASLAFEALSRGAKEAILIDINQENLNAARQTAHKFGEEQSVTYIKCDIAYGIPKAKKACDIIFIDPPYDKSDLITPLLNNLVKFNWLKPKSVILIEHSKRDSISLSEHFNLLNERKYGKTSIEIIEYNHE